jgi:hypothetical protein
VAVAGPAAAAAAAASVDSARSLRVEARRSSVSPCVAVKKVFKKAAHVFVIGGPKTTAQTQPRASRSGRFTWAEKGKAPAKKRP